MPLCSCGRWSLTLPCYGCQVAAKIAKRKPLRMALERTPGQALANVECWAASLDRTSAQAQAQAWNSYADGCNRAILPVMELRSQLVADAGIVVRTCARCGRQDCLVRPGRAAATCERCRRRKSSAGYRARSAMLRARRRAKVCDGASDCAVRP